MTSLLLAIPLAAIRVGPAPLVQATLDDLLIKKDTHALILYPLGLIGLYVLNFAVRFGHYFLLRHIVIRVNGQLKLDLFKHILEQPAQVFNQEKCGILIARTLSDPDLVDSGMNCFNVLIREPLTLLLLFCYALKLNWSLTLMTLVLIPALSFVFKNSGKNLKRYASKVAHQKGDALAFLQENYSGIRVIKTFHLEPKILATFQKIVDASIRTLTKASLLEEAAHPLVELLSAMALAPILYYGCKQVMLGHMTAGDVFAFFTTFALMMNPLRSMNDTNMRLNQAAAACENIFKVFEWPKTIDTGTRQDIPFEQALAFHNVSFAYPDAPEKTILHRMNLTIPKGARIGIVGESGAGKSSITLLLTRIFDATNGSITLDGVDIRSFQTEALRKKLAVVSQDVFLFNDSVAENIRCGQDASMEAVRNAAEKAHALAFIDNLPQGMETIIGDRGQKLSGGQRQRLAIARAFLREAPLLILDEATSALDNASEAAIQEALEELMVGRTSIVIAHRLSTISTSDQIIVLKKGTICESGTHDELVARNGEYVRLQQLG